MTLLQFNPNLLLILKKNSNIINLVSQLNWDHLFLTILGKVSVPTVIYEDTSGRLLSGDHFFPLMWLVG